MVLHLKILLQNVYEHSSLNSNIITFQKTNILKVSN